MYWPVRNKFIVWLMCASALVLTPSLSAEPTAIDTRPRLAIIIDDIGNAAAAGRTLADLPIPLTFAVLPFTQHGSALAEQAWRQGKEIMLHAPMSNTQGFSLGRGGLYDTMSEAELKAQLRENIAAIPHVVGVNNHMGSQLTQNALAMDWVMQELNTRGLFFIDSRTIARTQAEAAAARNNTPHARRDVFLDHEQSYSHSAAQLQKALASARHFGHAIAIGHPHATTVKVLQDYAKNPAPDVRLVLASEIVAVYRPRGRALPPTPAKKNPAPLKPALPNCPMPPWLHESFTPPADIFEPRLDMF